MLTWLINAFCVCSPYNLGYLLFRGILYAFAYLNVMRIGSSDTLPDVSLVSIGCRMGALGIHPHKRIQRRYDQRVWELNFPSPVRTTCMAQLHAATTSRRRFNQSKEADAPSCAFSMPCASSRLSCQPLQHPPRTAPVN